MTWIGTHRAEENNGNNGWLARLRNKWLSFYLTLFALPYLLLRLDTFVHVGGTYCLTWECCRIGFIDGRCGRMIGWTGRTIRRNRCCGCRYCCCHHGVVRGCRGTAMHVWCSIIQRGLGRAAVERFTDGSRWCVWRRSAALCGRNDSGGFERYYLFRALRPVRMLGMRARTYIKQMTLIYEVLSRMGHSLRMT